MKLQASKAALVGISYTVDPESAAYVNRSFAHVCANKCCALPTVRSASEQNIPVMGVCLGHQAIAEAFGGKIVSAKTLMHGKTSTIISKKIGILKKLPKTFEATRYHSLIIDKKSLSKDLEITAESKDGLIMGVKHKKYNVHGVQFHPESIKTKLGLKILKNFIKL